MQPGWCVDLQAPDVFVIVLLMNTTLTVGVLLPPFKPRQSDVLPLEPRQWLTCRDRPHTRPSRAACMVALADLQPGSDCVA